jgi:Zn-dependent M32 family carboxypeptidase
MIVFDKGVESIKTEGLLYSHKDVVRSFAIMLMANAAESNLDMLMDCPEDYTNKKDIDNVFNQINLVALDMFPDYIDDLKYRIEEFLKTAKFKAHVSRLHYDKEGKLSDVDVELIVE